jgi:hypothetical protein
VPIAFAAIALGSIEVAAPAPAVPPSPNDILLA